MSIISRFKESQIGQFWLKHEQKIVLAIGIVLIAAVSFEAGFLKGHKNKQEPIIVNKVAAVEALSANTSQNQAGASDATPASALDRPPPARAGRTPHSPLACETPPREHCRD